MNCPKCQIPMREREKDDLIIDICPECRGIWLDAGELEKLTVRERNYYGDDDDDDDRSRRDDSRREVPRDDRSRSYDSDSDYRGQPKKKKSFLSSIFETMEGGGD